MAQVKRSEYIKLSRTLIRKLYDETCFGKGSLYFDNLKKGIPPEYVGKVESVLNALVKQGICGRKRKEHGWKYFLNIKRLDKIKEIIKEKGDKSVIPILSILLEVGEND
ncbi:MAG: hypothetical protein ABIB47_02995 [Candidatus Woesearchaeota archaeon]